MFREEFSMQRNNECKVPEVAAGLVPLGKQSQCGRSKVCAWEKGNLRLEKELEDQNIQGLLLNQTGCHRRVLSRDIKCWSYDIMKLYYFSPCYDVASLLNHEQIIKIAKSSLKNVLLGNGVL